MSNLAVIENTQVALVSEQTQLLSLISDLAKNSDVSVEKMRAILDMKTEVFQMQAKIAFDGAMSRVQSEIKPIVKNKTNTQTKSNYATLDVILDAIVPVYTSEGFSLSFNREDNERLKPNEIRFICEVSHQAGFTKKYHIDLPMDKTGIAGSVNKTDIHAIASTNHYARRYLQCDIFNISIKGADTDGNSKPQATAISSAQAKMLTDLFINLTPENKTIFSDWIGPIASIDKSMFNEAQKWLYSAQRAEGEAVNA